MNHKRKRPKNRRAGCLMCKPWKVNGVGKPEKFTASEQRRLQETPEQLTVEHEAELTREAVAYAAANEF